MKSLILAATMLAVPVLAHAQAPQAVSPQSQALQETVIKLTGESLDWHAQAIALKAQVDDLTKQLAAAKKDAEAAPPK